MCFKRLNVFLIMITLITIGVMGFGVFAWASPIKPVTLKVAASTEGTAWYLYGGTYGEVAFKSLPEGSRVDVMPGPGAVPNPIYVSKGKADIGLTSSNLAYKAWGGKALYSPNEYKNLRLLTSLGDQYWLAIAARKDTRLTSLKDIVEKKYPLKLGTSIKTGGTYWDTITILEYNGCSEDKLRGWGGSITPTSFSEVSEGIRDKRLNAVGWYATRGHPRWTELTETVDMTFLPYGDEIIEKMIAKHGLTDFIMPANTFEGQDKDIRYPGITTIWVASKAMSDELAYILVKAFCENAGSIRAAHAGLRNYYPEKLVTEKTYLIPYHPGAEKYYREQGWIK
jgi:TRAP transporter TAXI family solute receptor